MPKRNKQPKSPSGGKQQKQARDGIVYNSRKEPRTVEQPDTLHPLWSFRHIDLDGPWPLSVMSRDTLRTVLERLKGVETLTWVDLGSGGSHVVDLSRLIKRAQDRLIELKLTEINGLYSLRVSGKERIWAIKQDQVLKLLWWDPEHEVCPSNLK